MRLARALSALALADFRERTRRYSFLVMLALVGYLGYTVNHGDFSLKLDSYQGINNSAWVGSQMTLVLTFMLSLFGFYLVKNSVERDTRTGVGQIIATTPLSGAAYLVGKWLSHFLILGVMVILLALAALVMQLLSHQAPVDAWALVAPFLCVALPCMALVAGLAVFFEAIPFLRGGLGNLVYFFGFMAALVPLINVALASAAGHGHFTDPLGLGAILPPMQAALRALHPDYSGGFSLSIETGRQMQPFLWEGMRWRPAVILGQWAWALAGLGLALAGALFFERFDPARLRPLRVRRSKTDGQTDLLAAVEAAPASTPAPVARLSPLTGRRSRAPFFSIFLAELRLLLKGWPWWWYAVSGGLIAAGLFSPLDVTAKGLLPAAWIWPVLVWSGMGCREQRYQTQQLVFSAPHPLWRQIPAGWLAGAALSAAVGSGAGLALLLAGSGAGFAGWLAGMLFIPSLALALGVWSGGNRLFEVVYLVWWYLGPVQHLGALDFTSQPAYLLAALALLAAAGVGRSLRLHGAIG